MKPAPAPRRHETGATRPVAYAVSLLLRREASAVSELLTVRRPPDDEHLPDVWGLPAASLRPGESWWEAAGRAGRDKLGIEPRGLRLLGQGRAERADHELRMRLFGAAEVAGRPSIAGPSRDPGVTRYVDWAWGPPERLEEAAAGGSLCSRLCLEWLGGITGAGSGADRLGSDTPHAGARLEPLGQLLRVEGVLVRGHGVASGEGPEPFVPGGTLPAQLPAFRERGLDLGGLHPGTLNVSTAPRRVVWERPRATFREVRWHPELPAETFSFSPCRVELAAPAGPGAAGREETARETPGWLYRPHPETKPRHHQPGKVVEVIAERLRGTEPGSPVILAVDPWEVRPATT